MREGGLGALPSGCDCRCGAVVACGGLQASQQQCGAPHDGPPAAAGQLQRQRRRALQGWARELGPGHGGGPLHAVIGPWRGGPAVQQRYAGEGHTGVLLGGAAWHDLYCHPC